MKAFTDLKQSRELCEILPHKSADGLYRVKSWTGNKDNTPTYILVMKEEVCIGDRYDIPCWSLGALISILPHDLKDDIGIWYHLSMDKGYIEYSNHDLVIFSTYIHVDACVEMIKMLHERKMLSL